jgi:Leucine-rich repeat (LRR) protein
MRIHVKYSIDDDTIIVSSFEEIKDNVVYVNCRNNQLKSLPENIGSNWTNLTHFYCYNNLLTSLPENIGSNWTNLTYFYCGSNQLKLLPENIGSNWTNLTEFSCYDNKLNSLPENIGENWTNLTHFRCSVNHLISLPKNIGSNWANLTDFSCRNNHLKSLPLSLMNCRNLRWFHYSDNEIDNLPIQLMRFINRIRQTRTNELNIYNDGQNVHNSNIQLSIKQSIENITTRKDLPEFDKDKLISIIVDDKVLNCKEQLIEYINDDNIHSLLLLTFGEVLWYVLMTINKDFSVDEQSEIKYILNTDMSDALCKCFTGRISRVVNCLSGFSSLVNIQIKDESQIGNIIVIVKEQLGDSYTVEKHKELVYKELVERGFDIDTINEWLEHIE